MFKKIILFFIILLFPLNTFAITDNGDGTRTFLIDSSTGDFSTPSQVIWGHPVGVMAGDTLTSGSSVISDDLTIGAEGASSTPINIKVAVRSITNSGYSYINMLYCIIANSTGNGITTSGANNNIINCTIYNTVGNGVSHSVNTTIENCIFRIIGGSDINTTGGSATTSNNYSSSNDPKLMSNYGLYSNSPCINAGTIVSGIHDLTTPVKDIKGVEIIRRPDIGAVAYSDQNIYLKENATSGNGTKDYPYGDWTNISSLSGYYIRNGTSKNPTIYLQGDISGELPSLYTLFPYWTVDLEVPKGKKGSIITNNVQIKIDNKSRVLILE